MAKPERPNDQYSEQEIEQRIVAALRGARRVGPKPMSSVTPKRRKAQPKRKAKKAAKVARVKDSHDRYA